MTAASSVKPKSRFSSRNVNALYKAPALRDCGGVSAGYRTGGVNGLSRMVVLRGPVRGGALGLAEANAVAAPAPINTPSLRKEHMGQDIHVNLVPATKGGGGWATGTHDGSSGADASSRLQQHSAPSVDVVQRTTPAPVRGNNAWESGAPAALVAHAKPPGNPIKTMLSSGSGRWGDDAVEEDLVQVEEQREMEHRREFPDLHEPQANIHQLHTQDRMYQHMNGHHTHDETHSQLRNAAKYDDRPPSFHAPGSSHRHEALRGYDDHGPQSAPSILSNRDERGHYSHHVSTQDVRYSTSGFLEPQNRSDRFNVAFHPDSSRHSHHEVRSAQGVPTDRTYGVHRDQRLAPPDEFHREGIPRLSSNQSEQEGTDSQPRSNSVWSTSRSAPGSSNVWRMSETEVSSRTEVTTQPLSSSFGSIDKSMPVDSVRNGAPASTVRILKRDGPRMLFDHKSGTMVEVNEMQSSRRSSKAITAPPRVSTESSVKALPAKKMTEAIEQEMNPEPQMPAKSHTSDMILTRPEGTEFVGVSTDPEVLTASSETKITIPGRKATRNDEPSRKSRTKEPKSKPLPMGGKMKRVTVAYRPVTKTDSSELRTEKLASGDPDGKSSSEDSEKHQRSSRAQPKAITRGPESKSATTARKKKSLLASSKNPKTSKVAKTDAAKFKSRLDLMETKAQKETKQKPQSGQISASKKIGLNTKRSKPDGESKKTVVSTDQTEVDEIPDDGGGAFTTVKSRRAIQLERKKQREELAAALTGFHERYDVKRPSNRVNLPASIARFGRKGLLVGFKQKTEVTPVLTPQPAPVFEKSFIDAIRPPVAVRQTEAQLNTNTNEVVEESGHERTAHTEGKRARSARRERSDKSQQNTERQARDTFKPLSADQQAGRKTSLMQDKSVESHGTLPSVITSDVEEVSLDAECGTTRQPVLVERRVRPTRTATKEVKRIYVPKATQGQGLHEVPHISATLPGAAHVVIDSVKAHDNDNMTLEPEAAVHATVTATKYIRKTKGGVATSLMKKKSMSSTRSEAPSGQPSSDTAYTFVEKERHLREEEKVVKYSSSEPSTTGRQATRKGHAVKPTTGDEHVPLKQKSPSSFSTFVEDDTATKQSDGRKPTEPTSAPSEPLVKVHRRSSSSKGPPGKSSASSSSSQKIYRQVYKQVYVVKATATAAASPSAA